MKKTSPNQNAADHGRLSRLTNQDGRSQADILRNAIAPHESRERRFALDSAWDGNGTSIADVPEEELLKGFAARKSPLDVPSVRTTLQRGELQELIREGRQSTDWFWDQP